MKKHRGCVSRCGYAEAHPQIVCKIRLMICEISASLNGVGYCEQYGMQ